MGEYVTKILKCFGCIEGDEPIGFPSANQSGAVNKDEVVAPYLQVMARFRADIRNGMKGDKSDLAKAVSCKVDCIFPMVIGTPWDNLGAPWPRDLAWSIGKTTIENMHPTLIYDSYLTTLRSDHGTVR